MKLLASFLILSCAASAIAAESRIANVAWRGMDEFDSARVDNAMSSAVRRPGTAGGVGMPAIFLHPVNQGRAVAKFPAAQCNLAAGSRVFFLAHVGIADGFDWNSAEHPADGVRFYVTVNDAELVATELKESKWLPIAAEVGEAGGERRQLLARVVLATDSGPAGNANYDWAMFGDPMLVVLDGRQLPEATPVSGPSGVLVAEAEGTDGRIIVEGLDAAGQPLDDAVQTLDVRDAKGTTFVRFDFGSRDGCVQWRWRAEGCRVTGAWGGSWQPQIRLAECGPAQAVTVAGERLIVRATVTNSGPGTLLPEHGAYVECNGERKPVERLAPGQDAVVEFDLGAAPTGVVKIAASVTSGEMTSTAEATAAVWPKLPHLPKRRPQGARFEEISDDYLLIENPSCRWLICRRDDVQGALVYVWARGRWELAGSVAPWLSLVRDAEAAPEIPSFPDVTARRVGSSVRFEAESITGEFRCSLSADLPDDSPAMRMEIVVEARKPASLAALWGPAVHVGDRSTGATKGIAVFPGLEYLYGDERSSSERDLAPPLNKRWVPHRFKITVPMMAVETRDGGPVMALAWDPMQKWDGEHSEPAACFASPDFLTHQDNHLMQLMLPSVPEFISENHRRADEPLQLEPGKPWRLVQQVVASLPQPDATSALTSFEDVIGYPKAEAWPRSFEDEMALCRHGFMVTVWDEETQRSLHYVGSGKGNAPGFATLMLMDARAVAKGEDRKQLLDRVQLIGNKTAKEQGADGLASSSLCHIMGWEFPYHWGQMPDAVGGMKAAAYRALNSQEEDGGWGYYPDERRRELGEPGTRVIGICARNAYVMAKWVAISGDPVVEAALRKALEHMERYKVPRGAQGWECPIMEPDVLASAYAVRAYVWAYTALGEKRWLEKAQYWARTGLAFQYAWDDGEHPGMRYASIPVLGSTFFHHSWLGLPVQWCGLVYAYGLQELMRFDDDDLWRKQVEGITASALHQQWPMDEKPELAGTYPDSFGNWFTHRNPVYINPEDIAVNVLALRGLDPGLRSARVKMKGGPAHVTAPADIRAESDGNTLRFELQYLPDQVVYATIAPVALGSRTEVKAGGETLPHGESLAPGQTGWAHDADLNLLVVGAKADAAGKARVVVTGIRRSLPQTPEARTSWEFERGAEGWNAANACRVSASDGRLTITVAGEDPYAMSGPALIDAERNKLLKARVRLTAGGEVGLFWRSTGSPEWGADKELHVSVSPDGKWHEVTFDLSDNTLWSGKIVQIRMDVQPADVAPGTVLEVDWIRPEPAPK